MMISGTYFRSVLKKMLIHNHFMVIWELLEKWFSQKIKVFTMKEWHLPLFQIWMRHTQRNTGHRKQAFSLDFNFECIAIGLFSGPMFIINLAMPPKSFKFTQKEHISPFKKSNLDVYWLTSQSWRSLKMFIKFIFGWFWLSSRVT